MSVVRSPQIIALLLILLNACATLNEVTLTPFPETHTEYNYRIILPESTTEAVVFWYYGAERREQMIYTSGIVPIKTGVISTEIYFPQSGTYILTVYSQTKAGVIKQRNKYAVRWKPI
jgi:uncharacterized membrane protein